MHVGAPPLAESQTSPLTETVSEGQAAPRASLRSSSLRPGTRSPPVPRSVGGLGWGLPVKGHQEGGSVELGLLPAVVLAATAGPGTLLFFVGRPGSCF